MRRSATSACLTSHALCSIRHSPTELSSVGSLKDAKTPRTRRSAARHAKFEQFHVGSVHVAYISVEEGFRRQGIARKLYITAAKWMGEEDGLVLAASDLQQPEVKELWKGLISDPAVPTVTTEDGRPAIDYT